MGVCGFYTNSNIPGHIFLRPSIWVGKSCVRIFKPLPLNNTIGEICYRIILPLLITLAFIPSVMLIPIGITVKGIAICIKDCSYSSSSELSYSYENSSSEEEQEEPKESPINTRTSIKRESQDLEKKSKKDVQSKDELFVSFEMDEDLDEEPVFACPITQESLCDNDPVLLLEDGFTYSRAAIKKWLAIHPNNSPQIREIPSATLCQNRAFLAYTLPPSCPLTGKPYKEAYFCKEDGHTYEREVILKWWQVRIDKKEKAISPGNNVDELKSLTLYPNKILFGKDIPLPKTQDPIIRTKFS